MKIKSTLASPLLIAGAFAVMFPLTACKSDAEASATTADVQKEAPAITAEKNAPGKAAVAGVLDEKQAFATIAAKLKAANEKIQIKYIKPSPIAGMYEVNIEGKGLVYMEQNGEYFFDGKLLQIVGQEVVNVTDKSMSVLRKDLMASVDRDTEIIFSPKGEVKGSIAVFTDVDCGYCQKLHREVPALNEMGIEVRYLAYPRAGIGSRSYERIASAWCAENPQEALTKLKNREEIKDNVCADNPVADQYALGRKIGLTGTPAIVMETGELIPGYMPAKNLAERIGIN